MDSWSSAADIEADDPSVLEMVYEMGRQSKRRSGTGTNDRPSKPWTQELAARWGGKRGGSPGA